MEDPERVASVRRAPARSIKGRSCDADRHDDHDHDHVSKILVALVALIYEALATRTRGGYLRRVGVESGSGSGGGSGGG
jgi:hypothetical protein